jgi:histidyl-tRNA synthetase
MRDSTADTLERATRAAEAIGACLEGEGYAVIDTPLLEETELFIRKSGGELTSRLYTFTDPAGHKVSLRPEFTSSVIRHYVQERELLDLPVRWRYCGPVFRYEQAEVGGYRQFTQVGAELVGAAGVDADAEIICLAMATLGTLGPQKYHLRIGHLGVLNECLARYGLSEPARMFIASNMMALKTGRTYPNRLMEQAGELGLLTPGAVSDAPEGLTDGAGRSVQRYIEEVVKESMPVAAGRRTNEQILGRLLRKVRESNDPDTFAEALTVVTELSRLEGPSGTVLKEARRITSASGAGTTNLDELETLTGKLERCEPLDAEVTLDLGLARGLAYYTGVIFELSTTGLGETPVGGGGRFDGLVKALGGGDVPALGFAFNLDLLVDTPISGRPGGPEESKNR